MVLLAQGSLWAAADLPQARGGEAAIPGAPGPPEVSVSGSTIVLSFLIPDRPAGTVLNLSVDHSRVLGRSVKGKKRLALCLDRLAPGLHLLGYGLSGPDQVGRTEERFVRVVVPRAGISPGCPLRN